MTQCAQNAIHMAYFQAGKTLDSVHAATALIQPLHGVLVSRMTGHLAAIKIVACAACIAALCYWQYNEQGGRHEMV